VPPDYFSATGQRWGNPLYRWDEMKKTNYAWWIERIKGTLELVDIIRVDHFRGFAAYWEIPASEPTAINGKWVTAPGEDLFKTIRQVLGDLPIIAEDLGVITPDVEALRDGAGFPGMKVLHFAFAADASDPYLPHNYIKNCVVYSGTHDNDTTKGWYAQAPEKERDYVRKYLARDDSNIAWEFMRLAFASVADTAIVPLQDVLGLGSDARMNTPGLASGNWGWRFKWEQLPYWVAPQLKDMAVVFGRVKSDGAVDTAYRQSILE
jgi:4-alpha-glucanotransferase